MSRCSYNERKMENMCRKCKHFSSNFVLLKLSFSLTFRKFSKEFKVPEGVVKEEIASSYSSEGILTIHAPRKINAPEGAEVQEAMAAASKAYTTDDGRTSVKQDSSSASQMIATSTKSDDGSFSSSSTFSSSSMSSSSTTTTSGPGGMPMMSIGKSYIP